MKCISFEFILFLINIIKIYNILKFTYPSSISLSNGNILVIEKNGIYICDSSFKRIVNTIYEFKEEEKIQNINTLSNIIIKDKNNYIACLVNFKLYLFTRVGELLKSTNRLITEDNPMYVTLAPIFVKSNNYYCVVGYFDSNTQLQLIYFKINLLSEHNFSQIASNTYPKFKGAFLSWSTYSYKYKGLSCEYMIDDYTHEYNYLVCFLLVEDSGDKIVQDFYEITESKLSDYHKYYYTEIKMNNIKLIKSITIKDINKALIFYFIENGDMYDIKIYSFYYEYTSTHLDLNYQPEFKCAKNFYGIKISYIYEKNILSFSCIGTDAVIHSILFENNLNKIKEYNQFEQCESIYGHSIIYSEYYREYYIISDVVCNSHKRSFIHLIGDLPEIEEEKEEKENEEEEEKEKIIEINQEKEEYNIIEEIYIEEEKEVFEEKLKEIYYEIIEEKNILEIENEEKYEYNEEIIEETGKEKEEEIEQIYEEKGIILKEEKEEINIEEEEEKSVFIDQCPELEKCLKCNKESISKNLCLKCNNNKGYYLLKLNTYLNNNNYIECINDTNKPSNFYFDNENKYYEPCFETCAECFYKGNLEQNNCSLCDGINFIMKPDYENSNNCVTKCKYLYYYNEYDQYKCTNYPYCPEDYNFLIKNKNKCTNNCTNDDTYKYYYNRECLKQCPSGTIDDNNYICKDIIENRCFLSENNYILLKENITDNQIEKLTKIYAKEFEYTDTHVSIYKNDIYTITIYKDLNCIEDLELNTPEIIFGQCEIKLKQYYNTNDNLIVAILQKDVIDSNQRKIISYGLFSPSDGTRLISNDICEDDKLMLMESLSIKLTKSNIDISTFTEFYSKGIDIFNLSSPFYTDICFQYDSIDNKYLLNKDIALKDRVLVFFPNITLCEEGCEIKGINITNLKAICECSYSKNNKDILKDNALYQSEIGQFEEFISSINIYVIKCYKNILSADYFKRCIGGLIIILFLIIEILCIIHYYTKGFLSIKLYIFDITNQYINCQNDISSKNNKKRSLKNNSNLLTKNDPIVIAPYDKNKNFIIENNFIKIEKQTEKSNQKNTKISSQINRNHGKLILRRHLLFLNNKAQAQTSENKRLDLNSNNSNDQKTNNIDNNDNFIEIDKKKDNYKGNDIQVFKKQNILAKHNISNKDEENINNIFNISCESSNKSIFDLKNNINKNEFFEEYLQTEFDDMDFDDILEKDKRKFCLYLKEKIASNQIIINTFCNEEPFKPISIKILLLVLQIILYLLINGLFYDEEYASEVFHLEEDTFLEILGRFFGNLVYAALVGIIFNYIIEFFFIEESIFKKIFKKKKENIDLLKNEINQMVLKIRKRYIFFIILTILITLFAWLHISCFNIVYSHLKFEWIIFSVIIIVFMQIFSVLVCLFHSILRFISFKCKSEKIYKISYLIS